MTQQKKPPDWTLYWTEDFFMSNPLLLRIYTWLRIKSYYHLFDMANPNGKTCLEIGAGTGYISKLLTRKYQLTTTLIDNCKEAYQMFQRMSGEGEYVITDAFSFKPDRKFDIVFSDGLIEHFYYEERAKMIMVHKQLAKPNGTVIIFVPKNSWFVSNLLTMRDVLELKFDYYRIKSELLEAGLEPIAKTEDWHMIGVLATPQTSAGF